MKRILIAAMAVVSVGLMGCPEPVCRTDKDCAEGSYCNVAANACFAKEVDALGGPAVPTELKAEEGDGKVALTWKANAEINLKGYAIHWGGAADKLDQRVEVAKSQTGYTVEGLSNGTTYHFAIAAEDAARRVSALSAPISATPKATDARPGTPQNLVAAPGNASVSLTWAANTEANLKGYHLSWGTSVSSLDQKTFVAKTENGHTVTGLTNDTTYYFTVDAEDTSGRRSPATTPVSATPVGAPAVPSNLAATAGDAKVSLTWNANTEAYLKGYNIRWGTAAGALNQTAFVAKPETTYSVTGLTNNTAYFFAIDAESVAGLQSAVSGAVSATPKPADQTPPSILTTVPAAGTQNVRLAQEMTIDFSEPVDPSTFSATINPTIALAAPQWSNNNSTVKLAATSDLAENTTYQVTVSAKDLVGNALTGNNKFGFTTTTRPTIVSTTPANMAVGVAKNTTIKVTFSKPMDKSATEAAFSIQMPAAKSGAFAWNSTASEFVFTPSSEFGYGVNVQFAVAAAGQDTAGNKMPFPAQFGFSTLYHKVVTLEADGSLSGLIDSNRNASPPLAGQEMYVGDTNQDIAYRSFLTFNLAPLPSNAVIKDARVSIFVDAAGSPVGMCPSSNLGLLQATSVNFGPTLDGADYSIAPEATYATGECVWCPGSPIGTCNVGTNHQRAFAPYDNTRSWKTAAVVEKVAHDFANRGQLSNRSQFRIEFNKETNSDGNTNVVTILFEAPQTPCPRPNSSSTSCRPHLTVSYEHP